MRSISTADGPIGHGEAPSNAVAVADIGAALSGLMRRWPLVIGLPIAVAGISFAAYSPPPIRYETRLTFAVDVPQSALVSGSDEGTSAKVGEALIDDIHRVVQGDVFAAAVQERLPERVRFAPGDGQSSLSADDRHRVADVTVGRAVPADASAETVDGLRAELQTIALAIVSELQENGDSWFALLGADDVNITIVDQPDLPTPSPPALRDRVEIPLRIALAALLAIGFALALHARDQRIYRAADVEARTGLPVRGRIPHADKAGSVRGAS